MQLAKFKELLKHNNGIPVTEEYILFNDYELYSINSNKSIIYTSLEEALNAQIGKKTLGQIIEEAEKFALHYAGGRGSSGANGPMGGGFNHANDKGDGNGKKLLPAEYNSLRTKEGNFNDALKQFQTKHANDNIEYGISVDDRGFTYKNMQGGSTSVSIDGDTGQIVIHNHPNGSNFSDSDLINTALTKAKGVVATSSNAKIKGTYTFIKNSNFKSKDFIKAINNAKWPIKYNYNQGSDWWLKKNAKTYGYTYSGQF